MDLQNIHNFKRTIYLFSRDTDGELHINKDSSFYPYYYERSKTGEIDTYDGFKARKVVCSEPKDVSQKRSLTSYEADVLFTKRYIIDKIDRIDKSPLKYIFLDIEVLATDFPDPSVAKDTISCITIYNSLYDETQTWFLKDFTDEWEMLNSFIEYIKHEKPDVLLAWNMSFDYTYLHNRIEDFARKISPIDQSRYGENNTYYPAGISILDYMTLFKRIYMREQSYALNNVAQKHLNEESWKETAFGILNDEVKEKNINDVNRMIKLEKKYRILDYYDEIRRFSTCLWEDLTANSRILDIIILKEAKKRNIVLPNKNKERENFYLQGAYRRAEIGIFNNVYKADIGSMYPNQLINFCLDRMNICSEQQEDTIEINGIHIKQNQDTLLPYISKELITQKDNIKAELKTLDHNSDEYYRLMNRYNACKALVNSLYGVTAFPSFRLFNYEIASSITFLARDLLQYVEKSMLDLGYKVHYTDTDALIYEAKEDETELLNRLVKDWSIVKYNKSEINISFENEGKFSKLLILGKCRYYGYIESDKGTKTEIKGMEIKRSSSSKYEAFFQEELIEKILNKISSEEIIEWIQKEQERIKTLPLLDVSFPCKLGIKEYKNKPIFIRAYENSQKLFKDFKLNKGELYYYIYVNHLGYSEGKSINVIALSDKYDFSIERNMIDWSEIIRRNIIMKAVTIFEALDWGDIKVVLSNQMTLF